MQSNKPFRCKPHATCEYCTRSKHRPSSHTASSLHRPQRGTALPCPTFLRGSTALPEDEYVYQGGDAYQLTNVAQDFSIDNLDEEDTIAHYHTLDGDIQIERTNRIPIYAPRFASVRRVDELSQYRHQDHAYAVDSPLALDRTVRVSDRNR